MKDLFDTAGIRTTYGSAVFADHVPPRHRGRRAPARDGRLDERRQDQPARVRVRRHVAEPALRDGAEPGRARPHLRRLERRLGGGARHRGGRRRARHRHRRLDPDPGRVLRHRRVQAVLRARPDRRRLPARPELRPRRPDGARRRGLRRADARSWSRASTTDALASLEDVTIGVAWLDRCEPLVRARLEAVAQLFPRRVDVDFPTAEAVVPRVHARGRRCPPRALRDPQRPLRREHRRQGRALPGRSPTASTQRPSRRGESTPNAPRRRSRAATCCSPRPWASSRRRPTSTSPRCAAAFTIFTFPFNALGWPALALPCGTAEDGLPASAQIAGRSGADALVLAAGLTLEGALKP